MTALEQKIHTNQVINFRYQCKCNGEINLYDKDKLKHSGLQQNPFTACHFDEKKPYHDQ